MRGEAHVSNQQISLVRHQRARPCPFRRDIADDPPHPFISAFNSHHPSIFLLEPSEPNGRVPRVWSDPGRVVPHRQRRGDSERFRIGIEQERLDSVAVSRRQNPVACHGVPKRPHSRSLPRFSRGSRETLPHPLCHPQKPASHRRNPESLQNLFSRTEALHGT